MLVEIQPGKEGSGIKQRDPEVPSRVRTEYWGWLESFWMYLSEAVGRLEIFVKPILVPGLSQNVAIDTVVLD